MDLDNSYTTQYKKNWIILIFNNVVLYFKVNSSYLSRNYLAFWVITAELPTSTSYLHLIEQLTLSHNFYLLVLVIFSETDRFSCNSQCFGKLHCTFIGKGRCQFGKKLYFIFLSAWWKQVRTKQSQLLSPSCNFWLGMDFFSCPVLRTLKMKISQLTTTVELKVSFIQSVESEMPKLHFQFSDSTELQPLQAMINSMILFI